MSETPEKLIQNYLDRLMRQLSELSSTRREDVIREIRAHIEDSLTARGKRDAETVEEILGRLGDPEEYARQLYAEGAVDSGLRLVFCKYCGMRTPTKRVLCPNCGKPIRRPLAVSAISILSIVMGVFMVYAGAVVIIMASVFDRFMGRPFPLPLQAMNMFILFTAVGVTITVSGLGLWRMKAWGWWLTIISVSIGLGLSTYRQVADMTVGMAVTSLQLVMFASQTIVFLLILGYLIAKRRYFAVSPPHLGVFRDRS